MNVLIAVNEGKQGVEAASQAVEAHLSAADIGFKRIGVSALPDRTRPDRSDGFGLSGVGEAPFIPELAVVLGGDGSILRTARALHGTKVPILGINFGRIGFLANECDGDPAALVDAALSGCAEPERHFGLEATFLGEEPGQVLDAFALNDVTIMRDSAGRMVEMTVSVGSSHLMAPRGDGLVISSPTGSTAYSLAAGGPLVAPSCAAMVITPVAPHSLHMRPLLVGADDAVEVKMQDSRSGMEAVASADGIALDLGWPLARAIVRRALCPTVLLRCDRDDFYARTSRIFYGERNVG